MLRDVGEIQGSAVPGVAQLDQAIKGRAVVATGFQFVDEGVGEARLAAGEVVARVVGANLLQVVEALQERV